MSGRAYLSIGDVLTLLRQEFPDVTISKIRFLESQGLVNPERTPSGYRKFYDPDVDRLRWILRQQREHFLPLKVIKGRLEEVGEEGNGRHGPSAELAAAPALAPAPADSTAPERATAPSPSSGPGRNAGRAPLPGFEGPALSPAASAEAEPGALSSPAAQRQEEPTTGSRPAARAPEPPAVLAEGDMTLQELSAASQCPAAVLAGLQSYGLVVGRTIAGVAYYGEDALAVARLATAFSAYGVEPRHLRLHKHAADREAGFIGQVVLPLIKQRNPESRRRAHDSVEELSRLGQELRAVLLRRAVRDQLGG
jgi:DNA-binding transcriptional MerR regulator